MISKSEIESKAVEYEIHPTNVEKDYVFGWIINGFFTVSNLKEDIFLKGGNALRKGYFKNTRFSSDLDFGIPFDISQETLIDELNMVCNYIQERTEVTFITEEIKVEEKFVATETPIPGLQVWEVRVYFKDFQGHSDHLKLKIAMDITRFDKVMLPLQTVKLIHPYSDAQEVECEIRCMKLEEIIAAKMKCLLQRQHAPDLFDYVYSINLLGVSLDKNELIETFIEKTIFGRNPFVLKEILKKTSFTYFKEVWQKSIVCAKSIIIKVEDAIAMFLTEVENLFGIYTNNGFANFAYFPSDFRTPIMEAGRNQTRLKIRYNGADRIIEPYSLKYLQRKDGRQREYLYVYNCSGGSNPPGVRCFVHENIESIEPTNEKFTPKFQIELSKAGELPENKYLFDPSKPTRSPHRRISSSRRRSNSKQVQYVYQCRACGKKFYKSKMNSTIGQHKSKNGYRCGSRVGFYLTTNY